MTHPALLMAAALSLAVAPNCNNCVKYCNGWDFTGTANGGVLRISEQISKLLTTLRDDCGFLKGLKAKYPDLTIEDPDFDELTGDIAYDSTYSLISDMLDEESQAVHLLSMDTPWIWPLAQHLEPLPPALLDDFQPMYREPNKNGDHLGLPFRTVQVVAVIREDLFIKHGISYEWDTWDAWENSVTQLQNAIQSERNDPDYRALMFTHHKDNSRVVVFLTTFLSGFDPDNNIVNDNGTVIINTPAGRSAMAMMQRWYGTILNKLGETAEEHKETVGELTEDRSAVAFIWSSYMDDLQKSVTDENGYVFRAVPIPGQMGKGCSGTWAAGISKYAPPAIKEIAFEVVEHLSKFANDFVAVRSDQPPMRVDFQTNATEWTSFCGKNPVICRSMEEFPAFWGRVTHRPAVGCGVLFDSCQAVIRSVMDEVLHEGKAVAAAAEDMEKRLNVILSNWDPSALYADTDSWTAERISLVVVCVVCGVVMALLCFFMAKQIRSLRTVKKVTVPVSVFLGVSVLVLALVMQLVIIFQWNDTLRSTSKDLGEQVVVRSLKSATAHVLSTAELKLASCTVQSSMTIRRQIEADLLQAIPDMYIDPRSLFMAIDVDDGHIAVSSDLNKQTVHAYVGAPAADGPVVTEWVTKALSLIDGNLNAPVRVSNTESIEIEGKACFVNMGTASIVRPGNNANTRAFRYLLIMIVPEAVIYHDADAALRDTVDLSVILTIVGITLLVSSTFLFTIPLIRLAQDIEDVRTMHIKGVNLQQTSRLTEIACLLEGFQVMCRMMAEYKAFMPKTLFGAAEEDMTDDVIESTHDRNTDRGSALTASKTSRTSGNSTTNASSNQKKHITVPVSIGLVNVARGSILSLRVAQHQRTGEFNNDQFSELLTAIDRYAVSTNGVLHSFNTTRPGEFLISWGLASQTTSSVRVYTERAGNAAMRIKDAVFNQVNAPKLALACVAGKFKVGNVGNVHTRGFGIQGANIVMLEWALESSETLAKLTNRASVVVDNEFSKTYSFNFRAVDIVHMGNQYSMLRQLVSHANSDMKEWMYKLEDLEKERVSPLATFFQDILSNRSLTFAEAEAVAANPGLDDVEVIIAQQLVILASLSTHAFPTMQTLLYDAAVLQLYNTVPDKTPV
ncbi:hypothetical protein DIPPA_00304 [Diplonema papillatum]|nr:hypothetical protein DIPPA_00304 [Diplonema papillatum]|eukprot:gene15693-23955_t